MTPKLTADRTARIIKRLRRWIKAEWAFRLGPFAFTDRTTWRYVKAERRLRAALTGKADLYAAAARLGFSFKEKSKRPIRK